MIRKTLCATAVALMAAMSVSIPAAEAASLAMLRGKWTAVLAGNTGCGHTSMYVTFALDLNGVGKATIQSHSTGCANSTTSNLPIQIFTLDVTGQGTGNLSCGQGCGWNLRIQVSPDGNQMILTDVDAANPNNTPTGVALRQFP